MAPSHVDLSVLWVPIMPETSKLGEQMEQVGKDATESFGKGSGGLGDKIHESVTKSRDKIKDVFHRTGDDAGKAMSDAFQEQSKSIEATAEDAGKKAKGKFRESAKDWGKVLVDAVGPDTKKLLGDRLEETVGGALEGVLGENAKWAGQFSHAVADWGFDELKNKLGSVKDTVTTTKQAFADLTGGDTTRGIAGLVDGFGKLGTTAEKFGITLHDLPQPIQDAVNKTSEFKATAQGVADIFKDLPGKIGAIGPAIEKVVGELGTGMALGDAARQWANSAIPGAAGVDAAKTPEDRRKAMENMVGQADSHGRMPGQSGYQGPSAPQAPSGVDMGGVGGIGKGGDVLGSGSDAYDFFSSGQSLPMPPVPRNVGSDSGLTPTSSAVKKVVASMFPQINDIGGWRPPDRYNEHSSGQALDVMIPGAGTPQGKQLGDQIRDYVMKNAKSLGVDYALWQQTQWNPDGSHSGMENRGSPTKNHMDHVHIHTVKGGGTADPDTMPMPSMPRGGTTDSGDKIPVGTQHDPLYVMASDKGGGSAGGGGSSLAQQFGSSLLGGVAQSAGLDGSVFHTFNGKSNPMDFGLAKLGTGLLNSFGGMMGGHAGGGAPSLPLGAMEARHAGLGGIMPTPPGATPSHPTGGSPGFAGIADLFSGSGGGGGGLTMGSGPGGMVNAGINAAVDLGGALMSDLFNPGPGAPDSKDYFAVAPMPRGTSGSYADNPLRGQDQSVTHNHYGDVDQSFNVTNHGVKGNGHEEYKAAMNSSNRTAALAAGLPG